MYPRRPTFFRVEDAPGGRILAATVKWFDAAKGFGFVSLPEGGDAFLPMTALGRAAVADLREGAAIRCEIGRGAKGPVVLEVLAIGPAAAATTRARPIEGVVKWFAAEKGYGFVAPDGGGRDVFVHINVLRRAGIDALAAGQRVSLELIEGRRGPEAERIRLL
jgi:cold shock protein